jgi:hypothetical protein
LVLAGMAGFANAAENTTAVVTPPGATVKSAPAAAALPSPTAAKAPASPSSSKPLWSELTPAQQQALAPLASEWDKMGSARKGKWLVIGNKYGSMKPEEQQRVQARMREWIKLTPEQRRIARESYARAKKLNPNQKSEHWETYQQLPEEQKQKLAADAASKKRLATMPSEQSQSQSKGKTVQPIKSTPKPVLEQSVTPQAASHSVFNPSPQPATK